MLPVELQNEILKFTNIKCHGCLKCITLKHLSDWSKQNKFYYCSKVCYEFI